MIRHLALSVSLIVVGALPALAQSHPPGHARGYQHGPDHVPPSGPIDPALHALLHGEWTGTLTSAQRVATSIGLLAAADSSRKVTVTMTTGLPRRSGLAHDFVLNGDKVQWTQDLSGTPCKVRAVLSGVTPAARNTMNGTMACKGVESKFTLHRKA